MAYSSQPLPAQQQLIDELMKEGSDLSKRAADEIMSQIKRADNSAANNRELQAKMDGMVHITKAVRGFA